MHRPIEPMASSASRPPGSPALAGKVRPPGRENTSIIAETACPLCNEAAAVIAGNQDRQGRPLKTVACVRCGLLRTDPLPGAEELSKFHELEYRQSYKGVRRPKLKHVYRSGLLAAERLRRVTPHLGVRARVLDVGCGSGEWIYALGAAGHSAVGIEADSSYAGFGREEYGVQILTGSIFTQPPLEPVFDCVTLFHVLEHLPNPVEALRRIHSWTKDDGLVVIEVPNLLSVHQHPAKRFHYAHVIGFTPESLGYALDKTGWQCVEFSLDGYARNIFAIARRRGADNSQQAQARLPDFRGVPPAPAVSSPAAVFRYYLRPTTCLRWIKRMWQFAREFRATRSGRSPLAVLQTALIQGKS